MNSANTNDIPASHLHQSVEKRQKRILAPTWRQSPAACGFFGFCFTATFEQQSRQTWSTASLLNMVNMRYFACHINIANNLDGNIVARSIRLKKNVYNCFSDDSRAIPFQSLGIRTCTLKACCSAHRISALM